MPAQIQDRVLFGVDVPIFAPDGQTLLLRREVKSEHFSTGWEYVKGGLDEGETATQAALREANEEAGGLALQLVAVLERTYHVDARYRNNPHYDFVDKQVVVLAAHAAGNVRLDPHEHVDYRWHPLEEAKAAIWVEHGPEILTNAAVAFARWQSQNARG